LRQVDRELEAAIVRLLSGRSGGATICPGEAARAVGGDEVRWVGEYLGGICIDEPRRSDRFVGTQAAADAALASVDLTGYATRRNEVLPCSRRGASGLSPWIRHGHLTLARVWSAVDGPPANRRELRDELRWQEYGRHLYGRLGQGTAEPLRRAPVSAAGVDADP